MSKGVAVKGLIEVVGLTSLEDQYLFLAKQLTTYRKEYLLAQQIFDSEPDILVPKLQMLDALLKKAKADIVEVKSKMDALKEEQVQAKANRRWFGLRVS